MRDLAFVLGFFVAILPAFTHVFIAVLLWVWTAIFAPQTYLFGWAAEIPYNKTAAALTLLALIFGRERKQFHVDRTCVLIVLFLLAAAVSQLTAPVDNPLGWEIFDKLWKIVALNLLIVSFVRSRVRIHALLLVVCIATGYVAVNSGLKLIASGGGYQVTEIPSWGDNNHVGLIVLMTLPMLAYLAKVIAVPLVRFGAFAGMLFSVLCVIATNSRGAFVGLLVLAVAGLTTSRNRIRYILGLLLVGAVLSQTVSQSWLQRIDTIETADQDSSFMGRVIAWKINVLIALDRPLFGGGLHACQLEQIWNSYRFEFNRLSFIPTDPPDETPHAAHSIYFEVLGDTGFVGLFIFLGILVTSFQSSSRIVRIARGRPDLDWAVRLAHNLRLTLVVFVVSGAALSATYHDINFIVFALLSSLSGTVVAELDKQARSAADSRPGHEGSAGRLRTPRQLGAGAAAGLNWQSGKQPTIVTRGNPPR
jgi:putative inorganic carbon (HCO3(-)) transporter